jgi:histidinol phosphatase-like enzyme
MLEIGRQIISSSENGSTISNLITAGEYANDRPAEGSRSCIVGDRPADISAGLAHGVRIFHVDDREGLPSVTGRILDATDGGDKF